MGQEWDKLAGRMAARADINRRLYESVGKQTELVRTAARELCPVKHGELRQSISISLEQEGETMRGICYTNKEYAAYVEFGTGPNGEQNHEGISPAITPAYSQKGWMMPASAMPLREAEEYGFGIAMKAGKVIGYYTNGQSARPFMYPALKNNEEKVIRNIRNDLGEEIRSL